MGILDQFRLDGEVAVVTGAGKGNRTGDRARAGAKRAPMSPIAARSAGDLEKVAG